MVTVETPASFTWNDANSLWLQNYLMPKIDLLSTLIAGTDININVMDESQFKQLCQLLETTADGRELRNKMFKAWRSKKSRDSDNGKKLYTFNLSIKAGDQLKKVAKGNPLNKTLESLIFTGKNTLQESILSNKKIEQLTLENKMLKQKLAHLSKNEEAEIELLINKDLYVSELAALEKSQLIKQILMLKRKLQASEKNNDSN